MYTRSAICHFVQISYTNCVIIYFQLHLYLRFTWMSHYTSGYSNIHNCLSVLLHGPREHALDPAIVTLID